MATFKNSRSAQRRSRNSAQVNRKQTLDSTSSRVTPRFVPAILISPICFKVNPMRKSLWLVFLLAFTLRAPAQQTAPASHFDGNSWWGHVKFLADDALAGRDTGTEGLRKAQAYAVEQFEKAG